MIKDLIGEDEKIIECNENVKSKIFSALAGTSYSVDEINSISDYENNIHHIVALSSGKNGNGNWIDYIDDLKKMFLFMEIEFEKVWMIELKYDCPDDVYTVYVGCR